MDIYFQTKRDILRDFLDTYKVWVYLDDEKATPWNPSDHDNAEIPKRCFINDLNYLEFNRFKTDENLDGLRPRIELTFQNQRLEKNVKYHINYQFGLLKGGKDFRGLIFQIMDKTVDNKTLPIKQLEIRNNKLYSRWTEIREGGSVSTHISEMAEAKWDGSIYVVDMYLQLSPDRSKGFVKTYLNGVLVHDLVNLITASKNPRNSQVQVGIYCVKGFDLAIQVKRLSWKSDD